LPRISVYLEKRKKAKDHERIGKSLEVGRRGLSSIPKLRLEDGSCPWLTLGGRKIRVITNGKD